MLINLPLLFEDNHLLVLNKPPGLLTQPSGTNQESLEEQARNWLKAMYHKPGNVFLEAVHRLDKPVSGVVVFSKTSKALARLNRLIQAKETKKIYWAWVEGRFLSLEGTLENFLVHEAFQAKVVSPSHKEGKWARLTYRVLVQEKEQALLQIELETGRYHQIRAQLAFSGHPILGDFKYGSRQTYFPETIALHHRCLQLLHPISHHPMTFEAPVPGSFPEFFSIQANE